MFSSLVSRHGANLTIAGVPHTNKKRSLPQSKQLTHIQRYIAGPEIRSATGHYPKVRGKRACPYASRLPGSLTVEAALTLPMFFFAVCILWTFFSVMILQVRIQSAADDVSGRLAQQAYLVKEWKAGDEAARGDLSGYTEDLSVSSLLGDAAWMTWAGTRIRNRLSGMDHLPVLGGVSGIRVLGSSWRRSGDLDLQIDYVMEIPILLGVSRKIPMTQHSLRRSWTGSQSKGSGDEAEAEEMVYITDSGSVYHRDMGCYHLLLTVREVPGAAAGGQINDSGRRYTPCERCAAGFRGGGTVYVAREGDRYHTTRDCAGLKRSVRAVPLSEAGGRRACSNCGN